MTQRLASIFACVAALMVGSVAEARIVLPREARFLSPDRAGMIDGPNVYAYAKSNPAMLTDPSGRQIITYSGPTRPLFRRLTGGGMVGAGEMYGNGAQVDRLLNSMQAKGYNFSFFRIFDVIIAFGELRTMSGGRPWTRQAGFTFPAGECSATPLNTVVIDVGNVLRDALDYSVAGKTTSVEEVMAHEIGHTEGLIMFGKGGLDDPDLANTYSCEEEHRMHLLMYGGDIVAAEATWAGCSH